MKYEIEFFNYEAKYESKKDTLYETYQTGDVVLFKDRKYTIKRIVIVEDKNIKRALALATIYKDA